MTTATKVGHCKLSILEPAHELGNVSKASKIMG